MAEKEREKTPTNQTVRRPPIDMTKPGQVVRRNDILSLLKRERERGKRILNRY